MDILPAFVPHKPWAYGFLSGFVGYWCVYFASRLLSPLLFASYHTLDKDPRKNKGYQAEWDTRVASTVHAAVALAGAYYPSMQSAAHRADRVAHYDTRLYVAQDGSEGPTGVGPEFFCAVFVGYLLADIVPVVAYRDTMSNINELYGHHILASLGWAVAIHYNCAQWYQTFWLLAELSTPFVNLRWWLYKTGTFGSVYMLNGLVMTLTFGLVRVSHLPWTLSYLIADFPQFKEKSSAAFAYFFCFLFAFNACLQSYWFSLMIRGIVKKLFGKKKKKAAKGE